MDRLSPLDASFLRVESPSAHMHVGWLAELSLPSGSAPLQAEELGRRIASKLHLTPRFRQRLRDAPLGEPYWADDPGFRIEAHVNESPAATNGAELREITARFLSTQLDRRRPLWEILVVPRSGPGRAAVLGKVHHAMVDGIAAVQLGVLLFDLEPEPEDPGALPWSPERRPSPARMAVESVRDTAVDQFRAARQIAGIGLRPGQALRSAGSVRRAAFSLAGDLARPAPDSFLRKTLSPRRVLIPAQVDLARTKRLARKLDVKLNDVVLAVVAGALRELAEQVGAEPLPQRAMVPISVREDGESGGNRITFAFVDLPVDEPDPLLRLREVAWRMGKLKQQRYADGTASLLDSVGALPGPLKNGVARVAASPRTYNLTVSNVPGPTVPLYAAGAQVRSIHPVIPITEGHSLSIGVVSYGGGLHFGVYADPKALPEADRLELLLPASLDRLRKAASGNRLAAQPVDARVRVTGDETRGAKWRSGRVPTRRRAGTERAAARASRSESRPTAPS